MKRLPNKSFHNIDAVSGNCFILLVIASYFLIKMEKTKLYFNLERDFNDNIEVIANNHIDLENYLKSKFDITVKSLDVNSDECAVKMPNDSATYYAEIRWVVHI